MERRCGKSEVNNNVARANGQYIRSDSSILLIKIAKQIAADYIMQYHLIITIKSTELTPKISAVDFCP